MYAYEEGPVKPGEFAIVRSYDAIASALVKAEEAAVLSAEREQRAAEDLVEARTAATDAIKSLTEALSTETTLAKEVEQLRGELQDSVRCREALLASKAELEKQLHEQAESAKRFQCTYARVLDERNLLAAKVEWLPKSVKVDMETQSEPEPDAVEVEPAPAAVRAESAATAPENTALNEDDEAAPVVYGRPQRRSKTAALERMYGVGNKRQRGAA